MRLFFLDFNKEGPGVSKNAPTKEGLALFFDIFAREFTSLIKLNLFFVLCCIPIITIAPAIGAMTAVTIRMVQDRPSDLFYDFREAFKKNWKLSYLINILVAITMLFLGWIIAFCMKSEGLIYNIVISIIVVITILIGISWIYIFPMSVSVNLSFKAIVKNSFLLSIARIKYSFLTFVLCVGLFEISILFFPFTLPVVILFAFSFISFISSFCAWDGIKKFIIKSEELADKSEK